MKMKTSFVLAMVVVVLFCAGYSNATVLGTIESNCAGLVTHDFSEIGLGIAYPVRFPSEPGDPMKLGWDWSISLAWDVTPDDVGKTFIASADTHPTFDVFAFFLTNGIDNSLDFTSGRLDRESALISGIQDGVDFEGYTIDSIALTVNELFVEADPIYQGFANWKYDITYTIYGAPIPEPVTVLLLGVGCLVFRRRRK